MKVTFIRHAQSEYNIGKNNSFNAPITEDGAISCKNLDLNFDLLILSPLKRSIQTYANSNIKTKNIIINELFQECKDKPSNMLDNDTNYETVYDFENRLDNAIKFLKDRSENNIGIITHHDFVHKITKKITGKPISLSNTNTFSINM